MTVGSPLTSSVSGPGWASTKTIRFPSGDQSKVLPVEGRGALVSSNLERNRLLEPSAPATINPDFSPSLPLYAMRVLSGDQTGLPELSFPDERATVVPPARVWMKSWL